MSWTCTCDTQNLDSTRYCEFCGAEHQKATSTPGRTGMAWSPPTPPYAEEPWRRVPLEPLPADLDRELQAVKAKLSTPADRPLLDPEHVARFLANCRAKGYARTLPPPTGDGG